MSNDINKKLPILSVEDANLEFDVDTVNYCSYVHIKVEILDYTVL